MKGIFSVIALLVASISAAPSQPISVNRRQTPCGTWTSQTRIVGDGSPKEWRLDLQLSARLDCRDNANCAVAYGSFESITVEASLGGSAKWIDAGFSVSKSWETGNNYECGGEKGEEVCVGQSIPHTEYEVREGSYNSCTGDFIPSGDSHWITSPAKDGAGHEFYCQNKDCKDVGTKNWVEL